VREKRINSKEERGSGKQEDKRPVTKGVSSSGRKAVQRLEAKRQSSSAAIIQQGGMEKNKINETKKEGHDWSSSSDERPEIIR